MIIGIPPYSPPIEQGVRCLCHRYYVVATERADTMSRRRARERAEDLGAVFIDACEVPFMTCDCGAVLDFTSEASALVQ